MDFHGVQFWHKLDFLKVQCLMGGDCVLAVPGQSLEPRMARISRRQEVVCNLATEERKTCKDVAKGSFCVLCVLLRLKFLEHPCSAGCVMNSGTGLAWRTRSSKASQGTCCSVGAVSSVRNFRGCWIAVQGQSSQVMDLASAPGRDRTFDLRIRNPWRALENQGLAEGVMVS